ncbi:hypothetical protein F5Y08DRAFT_355163 [Xylaria arbuscula]|nr:hypothetical protein F5Y08DRAFT_355163 [Xylaria arbuscula]
MWARLLVPSLPTPLRSDDAPPKKVRERLPDEDTSNAGLSSPRKRARLSIRPIFDKYKNPRNKDDDHGVRGLRDAPRNRAGPSPDPESPMIRRMKREYAALRVTLHSNGAKDAADVGAALILDVEQKIKANLSGLQQVVLKERELTKPVLECEVETNISNEDGGGRVCAQHARSAVSDFQQIEDERAQQLARLWHSWEEAQADVDKLSGNLHQLLVREPSNGTNGMSSNCEYIDNEEFDIDLRIKKVVEDMAACEEELQQKLKNENTKALQAVFESSLG